MAFTYDSSLLSADTAIGRRYVVRLILSDTDSTDVLLQDAEIDWFLSANGDTIRYASIAACRSIVAKFARQADLWIGHTKIAASDRARQFRQLLDELVSASDSQVLQIFAGGQTVSGKDELDLDTDAVQPFFRVGMDSIDKSMSANLDFTVLP